MNEAEGLAHVRELVLERLKVASGNRMSQQMMEESNLKVWTDYMVDDMCVALSTHVMAHHLATEDVIAPFERTVQWRWAPKWPMALTGVGTMASLGLAAVSGSLWVVLAWAIWAALAVVAIAANPPVEEEEIVKGEVVVPVKSYAAFPESTVRYPKELRMPRMWQQVQPSYMREGSSEARGPAPERKELVVMAQLRRLQFVEERFDEWLEHELERGQPFDPDQFDPGMNELRRALSVWKWLGIEADKREQEEQRT